LTGNPSTQPPELHPPGDYIPLDWFNPLARSTVHSRLTVTFVSIPGFAGTPLLFYRYIHVQVCTGLATWLTTNPHSRPKSTISIWDALVSESRIRLSDKGKCHTENHRFGSALRIGGTDNLIRTSILAEYFCGDLRSGLQRKLRHICSET